MKTHWKKLINPDYIGTYSLPEGNDMNVTIKEVVRELVTGTAGKKEECTVAHLVDNKPFILNRTNCKSIQKITGTPYIEEWTGVTITVYQAITKLKGEDVECLRIREVTVKPELTTTHKRFEGAKTALKNGSITFEQLEKNYTISEQVKKALYETV